MICPDIEKRVEEYAENWDGWGDKPSERRAFLYSMKEKMDKEAALEEVATRWKIGYHRIGGGRASEIVDAGSRDQAQRIAEEKWGVGDGWSKFVYVIRPVE